MEAIKYIYMKIEKLDPSKRKYYFKFCSVFEYLLVRGPFQTCSDQRGIWSVPKLRDALASGIWAYLLVYF